MLISYILLSIAVIFSVIAILSTVLNLIKLLAINKSEENKFTNEICQASCKPLTNNSRIRLLRALDAVIPDVFGSGAIILTQMPYSEFLKSEDQSALEKINQNCADFVVIDANLEVICVIEYQCPNHKILSKKAREIAKQQSHARRAACASAKVPFIEIPAKFSRAALVDLLRTARSASV